MDNYFAEVVFEGRVQGVGFRLKTYNIATGYMVRGFVKNMPDSTVLLNAYGDKKEVEEFVQEIKRIMFVFIKNTQENYSYKDCTCKSFDIA